MTCRAVDRAYLIDLLGTGAPLNDVARSLGYSGKSALRKAMARLGVHRDVNRRTGVVAISVGKAAR